MDKTSNLFFVDNKLDVHMHITSNSSITLMGRTTSLFYIIFLKITCIFKAGKNTIEVKIIQPIRTNKEYQTFK